MKNNSCHDDFVIFSATPAQGFVFDSWNDGNKENPRRLKLDSDIRFVAQFAQLQSNAEKEVAQAAAAVEAKAEEVKNNAKAQEAEAKAEAKRQADLAKAQEAEAKAEAKRQADLAKAQEAEAKAEAKRQADLAKAQEAEAKAEAKRQADLAKAETAKAAPAQSAPAQQPKTVALEGSDGKKYVITAHSSNWWIGTVSGSSRYLQGTEATLTATPRRGYHFSRWQDGSVQNPRTIVVTADAEYNADFAIDKCKLELSVDSGVNGIVVGQGTYNYGDKVTVNAVPNDGYKFIKWSDGKYKATREIKMKGDLALQASFQPLTYDVFASVNGGKKGNGKVTGAGTYEYNKSVTLTAIPDSGYHFVEWNDNVNTNPRVFAATRNINYQATFAPNIYDIKLESSDLTRGNVTGAGQYLLI